MYGSSLNINPWETTNYHKRVGGTTGYNNPIPSTTSLVMSSYNYPIEHSAGDDPARVKVLEEIRERRRRTGRS